MSQTHTEDRIAATRQSLQSLDAQRKSLELEAKAILDELLRGQSPIGVDTPLVDEEGYPRSDIDIYRARTLRGRLAVIKTDQVNLMNQIHIHLKQLAMLVDTKKADEEHHEVQARLRTKEKPTFDKLTQKWIVKNWDGTIAGVDGSRSNCHRSFDNIQDESVLAPNPDDQSIIRSEHSSERSGRVSDDIVHHPVPEVLRDSSRRPPPLARIDDVAENSPAFVAGLRRGDIILAFGPITLPDSSIPFQEIGELVALAAGLNQSIEMLIIRATDSDFSQNLSILIRPQPWNGRGLLGCHIVPI